MIDKAAPILKENIKMRVIDRLHRLKIRAVSVHPPSDHLLSHNFISLSDTVSSKEPQQIEVHINKNTP
jgi:3-dehydroquinate dehydratase